MIQTIKLSQLVPSKRNVRRRSDAAAHAQLRADIEARRLLQNDNLLDRTSPPEVRAVLGHKLGH